MCVCVCVWGGGGGGGVSTLLPLLPYLQEYESDNAPKRDALPEDLVRATKGVTLSTAKAVQAGSSYRQEDIMACANMGSKALTNMMVICKVCSV